VYLGKRILLKYNSQIKEGNVIKIFDEDLEIQLDDNTVVIKKFWEVRDIPDEKKE